MATTIATRLAEWSDSLSWDRVPEAHRACVRLWVLDNIGVMLAAYRLPAGRAALAVARRQGGNPESTVVGSGERMPASWAALVHGMLAHCLDFDDTLPDSVVHPGSLAIPTALAVGEAVAAEGPTVLAAIAAGYEVAARLGAAAGRQFHARGFHASGVVGPAVAATVAGKLYGLTPRQTAEAIGLAGSMAGGLLEFLSDGSWSKRLHPGWADHGGVLAAQLAGAGFPGPVSVLEGRHGLYATLLGRDVAQLQRLESGLGEAWLSQGALCKLYPCAHVIHPFLDAARVVREQQGVDAGAVAAVECHVDPWQVPLVCAPRVEKLAPQTEFQARASLPFALAAALVDGGLDMDSFTPEAIRRPDILAMAQRITHVEAPGRPAGFAGTLKVRTRGGSEIVAHGGSEAPGPPAIQAKFRDTAGRLLPAHQVTALAHAIAQLDHSTPRALLALCAANDQAR